MSIDTGTDPSTTPRRRSDAPALVLPALPGLVLPTTGKARRVARRKRPKPAASKPVRTQGRREKAAVKKPE